MQNKAQKPRHTVVWRGFLTKFCAKRAVFGRFIPMVNRPYAVLPEKYNETVDFKQIHGFLFGANVLIATENEVTHFAR